MTDLRKILAMKLFVESSQIRVGYARFLRTAFWLRLLQISVMFNCRFKVQRSPAIRDPMRPRVRFGMGNSHSRFVVDDKPKLEKFGGVKKRFVREEFRVFVGSLAASVFNEMLDKYKIKRESDQPKPMD